MNYTDCNCTVLQYDDQEYKPVSGAPIVQDAAGYNSKHGRNYVIILNEVLIMPSLDHLLWNPNQMRHFDTEVFDNPYENEPTRITSLDGELAACLQHEGTTIFFDTWIPTEDDLRAYPHIVLTSLCT